MSNLVKINGAVSHTDKSSYVTGQIQGTVNENTNNMNGVINTQTHYTTHFRLGNTQCSMRMFVNLKEGDNVTAIGTNDGELEALIVANHTTKLKYSIKVPSRFEYILLCIFSIILGCITIPCALWCILMLVIVIFASSNDSPTAMFVMSLIALIICGSFASMCIIGAISVKSQRDEMEEAEKMLQ
jgi:hypothetical protein